ncbi:MAG: tetratricopeptide repeat protein [Acidobacteria bacterium]|nr:tetratricopeptide repeat protein [Acidobacteriota bacterium]
MADSYSLEEAAHILKVSPGKLRKWDQSGLVSPSIKNPKGDCYDFQDLIALRAAKELVDRGLSLRKIAATLVQLRRKLPGLRQPLASARIVAYGNRIAIGHRGKLLEPRTGQLLFSFRVNELVREFKSRKESSGAAPGRDADGWFRQGLELDQNEATFDGAIEAYLRAVQLDPRFADAWNNLGTIYYKSGDLKRAEQCYRKAIACDPDHREAHYNLGNITDESGRLDQAMKFLERALEIDPTFADAHFNLALVYEKKLLRRRARAHWQTYLHYDSSSPWAAFARRRLEGN